MLLNKHQIFAADDLRNEIVAMKEWGGDIKIRVMSVREQLNFDKFLASKPDDKEMAFFLIVKSCIDENNQPLFTEDDIQFLEQKSADSILKLFQAILALNKQRPDDVEKLAKN